MVNGRVPFERPYAPPERPQEIPAFIDNNHASLPIEALFYPRPIFAFPSCDSLLIAFSGALHWFLWTPTEPTKQARDVVGMIDHAEHALNQIANDGTGPSGHRIAPVMSSLQQRLNESTFLQL